MGHAELQPEDIDESTTALKGAIKRTWCDFCNTTSIHGLKYTNDEETNKYTRFIWILITLIMFICAVAMVITFYVDYRSNPTRMNVENDHAPISNLLFPTTTICPKILYNRQKSKQVLESLILPNFTSVSDIIDLFNAHFAFTYGDNKYSAKELNLLEDILVLNNLSILEFVRKISWDCRDLIYKCRYNGEIVPCPKLFQFAITSFGFCCSFNLNQSNINFTNLNAHSGMLNGLSLILYHNTNNTFDRIPSYSDGFRVLIQEANTIPSSYSVVKFVPLNEEVFMSIQPKETVCSQAVKDLSFENRQCVFPYEEKLTFFPTYEGANCELNCRAIAMLKYCGCYTYFLFNNNTNERICTYKDLQCLTDNFDTIVRRRKKTPCACYKNCENIEYNIQVTSAALQLNFPTIDSFYDGLKQDYSVVHIYMSSQVYRRFRHDLLSNMVSLVSNLGSAFSLFVGMSMVSAVEIFYYFSIILNKYYRQECRARQQLFEQKTQRAMAERMKDDTTKTDLDYAEAKEKLEDIEN